MDKAPRLPPLRTYAFRQVVVLILAVIFVTSLVAALLLRRHLEDYRKVPWYKHQPAVKR